MHLVRSVYRSPFSVEIPPWRPLWSQIARPQPAGYSGITCAKACLRSLSPQANNVQAWKIGEAAVTDNDHMFDSSGPQAIYDAEHLALIQLTAWTLTLRDADFIHQHVVDAWAAQHADADSKPISVAFALVGLFLHLEKGLTGREVQRAHMQLAQPNKQGAGRRNWPRFQIPEGRRAGTVADVVLKPEEQRKDAIDSWCRSVWQSWSDSHEQVRRWARSEGLI